MSESRREAEPRTGIRSKSRIVVYPQYQDGEEYLACQRHGNWHSSYITDYETTMSGP